MHTQAEEGFFLLENGEPTTVDRPSGLPYRVVDYRDAKLWTMAADAQRLADTMISIGTYNEYKVVPVEITYRLR